MQELYTKCSPWLRFPAAAFEGENLELWALTEVEPKVRCELFRKTLCALWLVPRLVNVDSASPALFEVLASLQQCIEGEGLLAMDETESKCYSKTLDTIRGDYVWLIKEGVRRGSFRYGRKTKEHCRAFCVKKKDD